ncbi:hypothetical protein BGY98DRAFT_270387 [Russula aff. rugulosa BPL654]|nr:hypothetical protein BGY98DRAFT_270387 [Russula aff. rugulosa BPL654]
MCSTNRCCRWRGFTQTTSLSTHPGSRQLFMMLALRNAAESTIDPLTVMKFWLIVLGIYIWEFFTNLNYEWNVFRGHQRYRWTIWIYSVARLSGLLVVILTLANFSITTEINCQAWFVFGWFITSLGCYGLASILIMLRIFAIWDKNKVIMIISAVIWVTNMGFQFSGIFKSRAVWVPAERTCVTVHGDVIKLLCLSTLATDITLLLIMLAGLLRLRNRDRAFLDLAYVLWKQGLVWLVIATAAEVPQVVFLFLNVNDAFQSLFLLPATITIVIAATRTYRALTSYGSTPPNTTGPHLSNPPMSNRLVSSTKDTTIVHIPSNRLEVAVHKTFEEYPMSNINRSGSYPDAQLANKPPHEFGLDGNV